MNPTRTIFFLGSIFALSMLAADTMVGQMPAPVTLSAPVASSAPAAPSSTDAPQAVPSGQQSSQSPTFENWNALGLEKSGLNLEATGAVVLGKTDVGACTRERLRMQWRLNDPIDLYLIRPQGAQKTPVVLFLYDYSFDEEVFLKDQWCDVATRQGFAVVGLPSALSWSRIRPPRPMKDWFVSELQEALATSAHDVQMVINTLAVRGDIDTRQVGIFGEGSGGAVAILAAAADSRIGVLDLMNPWGDWPDWLKDSPRIPENERAEYLKPEFLARVLALDPVTYLPQLEGRAIHIQQVLADPITPSVARDKISAAAPHGTVTRYNKVTDEAKALGSDGIVGWLGGQLHSSRAVLYSQGETRYPAP